MFKITNKYARAICEIYSNITIKTLDQRDFIELCQLICKACLLLSLLLTLNKFQILS